MKVIKLSRFIVGLALAGILALAAACQAQQPPAQTEAEGQATAAPAGGDTAAPAAEAPAATPPAAAPAAAPAKPASGGSAATAPRPSGEGSAAPGNGNVAEAAKPAEPVMVMATVPEGKNITITLNDPISSKTSRPGDPFTATVKFDVQTRAHPEPIIPAGSTLSGSVVEAQKATQMKGQAKLVVKFEELRFPSGKTIPITASLVT